MIVVSCNYDMGLMDDLIELFMMGGYTIYFLMWLNNCNFIALTVDVFHLILI